MLVLSIWQDIDVYKRQALSRALPVFFALAFGGEFVQGVVNLVKEYQWVADGLTLAGRMLPGLGFAILLRYLPVKRNLHYLAMGFGLTAMLTVLYSNVTSLGGAVAGIIGTLPAEVAEKIGFVNNFKGLSMIGISIVGIFLAVVHFKNSQKVAVAAPSTPSESGEDVYKRQVHIDTMMSLSKVPNVVSLL